MNLPLVLSFVSIAQIRGVLVPFAKGQRKDDVANELRRQSQVRDGVVFVGVAQEKASAFKGKKVVDGRRFNFDYSRQTVGVNHYYFYLHDQEFGPAFIKIGTYAPFPIRVCLNGHEWVKRQLSKQGIAYEGLDNGFRSCAEPTRLQVLADSLGPPAHSLPRARRGGSGRPEQWVGEREILGPFWLLASLTCTFLPRSESNFLSALFARTRTFHASARRRNA